jgi:hypothetical protein
LNALSTAVGNSVRQHNVAIATTPAPMSPTNSSNINTPSIGIGSHTVAISSANLNEEADKYLLHQILSIFDESQEEVLKLLKPSFNRFRASNLYQKLLMDLEQQGMAVDLSSYALPPAISAKYRASDDGHSIGTHSHGHMAPSAAPINGSAASGVVSKNSINASIRSNSAAPLVPQSPPLSSAVAAAAAAALQMAPMTHIAWSGVPHAASPTPSSPLPSSPPFSSSVATSPLPSQMNNRHSSVTHSAASAVVSPLLSALAASSSNAHAAVSPRYLSTSPLPHPHPPPPGTVESDRNV